MEYLYLLCIAIVSCLASVMTFMSGFGLGTILLPVFLLFFPLPVAIIATAIVHFGNNIGKLIAIYHDIDIPVLLRFGVPAITGAGLGALLFDSAASLPPLLTSSLFDIVDITFLPVNVLIGLMIIVFTFLDEVKISGDTSSLRWLIGGGFLSGFFGGISGHQGALRSMVLSRTSLTKQQFVATGVVIACCVDIVRMFFYSTTLSSFYYESHIVLSIIIALLGASVGIIIGKRTLSLMTNDQFHRVVKYMLLLFGVLLGFGFFTH